MAYLGGDYRQAIWHLAEEAALNAASLSSFTSPADGAQWTQIDSELWALETEIRNDLSQESRSVAAPSGTPQAKLGVVLRSESTSIKQDGHETQPLQDLRPGKKNAFIYSGSLRGRALDPQKIQWTSTSNIESLLLPIPSSYEPVSESSNFAS